MKIVISAESTIDIPPEMLKEYNIQTLPFGINFDDKLVDDKFGISNEIFEFVEKTKKLPKTSAVSPEQYEVHFEKLKKEYGAIIHISLSSYMSSAYNNACSIASNMENVYVLDSKSLSTGIALLAIKGKELIDAGKDFKTICEILEQTVSKVQASFVIEKLNYLYKGGRCSALTLLGTNLLKIKPQIIVKEGRMIVGRKYIGNLPKIIEKYSNDILADNRDPDLKHVFITHSSPMPEIEEKIYKLLKERGFENIHNTLAGGTISSHCGPNCIGILFINK